MGWGAGRQVVLRPEEGEGGLQGKVWSRTFQRRSLPEKGSHTTSFPKGTLWGQGALLSACVFAGRRLSCCSGCSFTSTLLLLTSIQPPHPSVPSPFAVNPSCPAACKLSSGFS